MKRCIQKPDYIQIENVRLTRLSQGIDLPALNLSALGLNHPGIRLGIVGSLRLTTMTMSLLFLSKGRGARSVVKEASM